MSKKFITESPKFNFFFGLIAGVAIVSLVGFTLLILNRNPEEKLATQQNEQVAGEQQVTEINFQINENDHVLGNPNAVVKIFGFSDFQCPYCSMFHEVMNQIAAEYGDSIAWVFKQFPIASHPLGMPGALATECAGEQGKFWEMSDKIFSNQETMTANSFKTFAEELNLNVDQFNSCVVNETYKDKIIADYDSGIDAGVEGTPTNFINGQIVPGAVPYENMKEIIDELLNQ